MNLKLCNRWQYVYSCVPLKEQDSFVPQSSENVRNKTHVRKYLKRFFYHVER